MQCGGRVQVLCVLSCVYEGWMGMHGAAALPGAVALEVEGTAAARAAVEGFGGHVCAVAVVLSR